MIYIHRYVSKKEQRFSKCVNILNNMRTAADFMLICNTSTKTKQKYKTVLLQYERQILTYGTEIG